MLAPNTILQNRYRIKRKLGQGGMGTVYEAIDQRVNSVVAVKENEASRSFEHEAAILANLRHGSLPKVMDYFSENERDYLVMEYIPGHDLGELLVLRGGPFPQSQVLGWADKLLNVLEHLHRKKLLHRDIKPSNVKVTREGELYLLDFGLAKGTVGQMPAKSTSRSALGYTIPYAAFEQINGQGTDVRSDIYSLGATLYQLLTGVKPVDASTRYFVTEDGQPDPLTLIQTENPHASPHVAGIIHSAMALNRKLRPASATEMREALKKAAIGEVVQPDFKAPYTQPVQPKTKRKVPTPAPTPTPAPVPSPVPVPPVKPKVTPEPTKGREKPVAPPD